MEEEVRLIPPDPTEAQSTEKSPPRNEAVIFDAASESVILKGTESHLTTMKSSHPDTGSDTDGTTLDDDGYRSVLLANKKKRSFFPSYRTHDPERTITPFAVILLAVLFVIYILNQADRLVLPVAIPAGLRCANNDKNECRNLTDTESEGYTITSHINTAVNLSNETNRDCIDFDDFEQGLLTGKASKCDLMQHLWFSYWIL